MSAADPAQQPYLGIPGLTVAASATIDAHVQVGPGPDIDAGLDSGTLGAHLAANGIDAALVCSPDNALTARVVHDVPAAFGLYWADPQNAAAVKEAADYLDDPRFRGIRLHPALDGFHPDCPAVWPLLELLIERDLPALIHCGHPGFSEPWPIEELITRYEHAKIILGHMGYGTVVYVNAAIAVAARHPNVWLETSGMPMPGKIRTAVRTAGSSRVMYGSGSPLHDPHVEQLKICKSGLDEDAIADVMYGTARQLFFAGQLRRTAP